MVLRVLTRSVPIFYDFEAPPYVNLCPQNLASFMAADANAKPYHATTTRLHQLSRQSVMDILFVQNSECPGERKRGSDHNVTNTHT